MNHFDDIDDDPYRKCVSCDLLHWEENGRSCPLCDEWYCYECFAHDDHASLHWPLYRRAARFVLRLFAKGAWR